MDRSAKICAVLLAAGEGSRLGKIPKSLLTLHGETYISRQLNALKEAGVQRIHIVTGFYHQQIEATLGKSQVEIVRNPAPDLGQQHSVSLGLESLPADVEIVLIALADQPLIEAKDITELLTAFAARKEGIEILYPLVGGQRGNPVLLSGQALKELRRQGPEQTCRQFIDSHPAMVQRFETSNKHFIVDIDTPEDLARLVPT